MKMAKLDFPGGVIVAMVSVACEEITRKRVGVKSVSHGRIMLFLLLFLAVIFIAGCRKSEIEPEFEPELLTTSLGIALVPGGMEEVTIRASDKHGDNEGFTVTIGNAGVANVTTAGNTFTVTGSNYGSTKITITSSSGKSCEIPVRIYNAHVLETEELLITFSQTFQFRWNDSGSGLPMDGSYWHPVTTDGFMPLGSLGFRQYYDPNGIHGVMVVKAKNGSDALTSPIDYTQVWNDSGSGASNDGSFWMPVPPAGYKAMGVVAQKGYNKPGLEDVVCIREDLTIPGEAGDLIWGFSYTMINPPYIFNSWKVEPPVSGPHENAYLSTGTFIAQKTKDPPSVHAAMNVLNVTLPMLVETPYQSYVPTLKGYGPPPDETIPILAREMLVPCTILSDPQYINDQMWRITNTPFYRLERQVFYKLLYHNHNQTSVQQHNSYTRKIGITATESNEYWSETSISITAETGVSLKMFSAKVSVTVSKSFGYSTMTSVAELQQDEYESGVDVPPGKAVAIWQRYNRFVLKRHNGTSLEPVKAWEFGINSFVTDEYPD